MQSEQSEPKPRTQSQNGKQLKLQLVKIQREHTVNKMSSLRLCLIIKLYSVLCSVLRKVATDSRTNLDTQKAKTVHKLTSKQANKANQTQKNALERI